MVWNLIREFLPNTNLIRIKQEKKVIVKFINANVEN